MVFTQFLDARSNLWRIREHLIINLLRPVPLKNSRHVTTDFVHSGQRVLEDFEGHLSAEEQRRATAQVRLDKSSKILTDVKSGVEHLAEKLKNLKAVSIVTDAEKSCCFSFGMT